MGPEYFWMGGMWIFPIIMIIVMLIVIYLIFGRGCFRPPWYGPDKYHDNLKSSESALEILKNDMPKEKSQKKNLNR